MKKVIGVLFCVFILSFGCATTTTQLQQLWDALDNASYQVGYAAAALIYAQTGKKSAIDDEIIRIGEQADKVYLNLTDWEGKSYIMSEAKARIRGLEDYRKGLK